MKRITNAVRKTPVVKSLFSRPPPPKETPTMSITERINANRTMSTNAGPRNTLKLLSSAAVDRVKKYFSEDPLRLKKYLSEYHFEALAAAQKYALQLMGNCEINFSVDDLKSFSEMVIVVVNAHNSIKPFLAELRTNVTTWLQTDKKAKVPEHVQWFQLDSNSTRIIYLVCLFGVVDHRYVSHAIVQDHSVLLVKGCSYEKGKGLVPVEDNVPLPANYDFKLAKATKQFYDGVAKIEIRNFKPKVL